MNKALAGMAFVGVMGIASTVQADTFCESEDKTCLGRKQKWVQQVILSSFIRVVKQFSVVLEALNGGETKAIATEFCDSGAVPDVEVNREGILYSVTTCENTSNRNVHAHVWTGLYSKTEYTLYDGDDVIATEQDKSVRNHLAGKNIAVRHCQNG